MEFDFALYFNYSGNMEMYEATEAFSSLSQETRLRLFKLLIEYGCEGLVPGKIAKELDIPDNTLSFHLSHMTRARLIKSERNGRSITYFANNELIENLLDFIQANCCSRETKRKFKERKC